MKLYFENAYGTSRIIAEVATEQEAIKEIYKFIDKCNKHKPVDKQFKSYYTRTWTENNKTWYDVGSWSEYFVLDKVINNEDNSCRS